MTVVDDDACSTHGSDAMRVRAADRCSFCTRCAESSQEAARRLQTAQERGSRNKAGQRRATKRGKRKRVTWRGRTLGVVQSVVGDRVTYESHHGYVAHVSLQVPWCQLIEERDPVDRPRDRRRPHGRAHQRASR